jgi:bacterioferritin-associated ferredoxin
MIVCVCNALREKDCREVAAAPDVRSTGCVYRRLNCRVRCGACLATMQAIVDELRDERAAHAATAITQPADPLMCEPSAMPAE